VVLDSALSLAGLFHCEFSCRIGLEACVGDPKTALHRTTVDSFAKPGFRPLDGAQPVTQASRDRVVLLLCCEALGGIRDITRLVGCASILLPSLEFFLQKLFNSATLGCE
jgi:hypothetical protein